LPAPTTNRLAQRAKDDPMSDAALITEMRGHVSAFVEPLRPRGMKRAWHEASRVFGITARRVRAILNGEVRRLDAGELLRARALQQRLLRDREARLDHELQLVRDRIAALEADSLAPLLRGDAGRVDAPVEVRR
jgi:hypothetical protein